MEYLPVSKVISLAIKPSNGSVQNEIPKIGWEDHCLSELIGQAIGKSLLGGGIFT